MAKKPKKKIIKKISKKPKKKPAAVKVKKKILKTRQKKELKKRVVKKIILAAKPKKKILLKPKIPEKKPKSAKKSIDQDFPKESNDLYRGVYNTKIMVIGLGGGGSSIVSEIASRIKKASFLAINTDLQALKKLDKKVKTFQLGEEFTKGLGTGMDWELAKTAAQKVREKIKKLLEGQDLCIIVACLGGGAGSGAAPIFSKISRELGNLTYGIFTLPFNFEGEKKAQISREALKRSKPNLNAFSIIPNERIFQIVEKETPLKTALSFLNKNLAESLEGLIETIYDPGLINIDFADLRTIFDVRGKPAFLNTIETSSHRIINEGVKNLISSPLYPYGLKGATGVLFNIAGGSNLALSEISKISEAISGLTSKEAKIIFGVSSFPEKDKIKISLLATGLSANIFPQKNEEQKKEGKPKTKTKSAGGKISFSRKSPLKNTKTKPSKKPKAVKKASVVFPERSAKAHSSQDGASDNNIFFNTEKIRRSALDLKKEMDEIEEDIISQEKKWEPPAFLRRNSDYGKNS